MYKVLVGRLRRLLTGQHAVSTVQCTWKKIKLIKVAILQVHVHALFDGTVVLALSWVIIGLLPRA